MQQPISVQPPGVTVITQNPPVCDDKLQPSAQSQMKLLSILQIIMGIACVIFGIILSVRSLGYIANGIWGGSYFVVVGSIGLGAVRANTRCWLVAVMVLNIICSSVFFLPTLSMAAVVITRLSGTRFCDDYYSSYYSSVCTQWKTAMAFNCLILVMVIAELVITIWTAVLCCGAVCSCCKSPQRGQVLQYNATPVVPAQVVYPSVPATSYAVSMAGQQAMPVQNQHYPYPAAAHQQPVAPHPVQPQAPPGYYSDNQGNPHYP